jgi:hypothetical protein
LDKSIIAPPYRKDGVEQGRCDLHDPPVGLERLLEADEIGRFSIQIDA